MAIKSVLSKRECVIAWLIFAIFTGAFCYFQLVTVWSHHLDSAFLMEALVSIKKNGVPTSYIAQSIIDVFSTFTLNAENVCHSELRASAFPVNILNVHAYFILYPLATLTLLFSPHIILAVANGLSFSSVIFIIYWVIRRQGVPILGAIVFCLLIMAHPAWSHASLGDFYADRFFMPLGLLYVSMLYNSMVTQGNFNWNYLLLILVVGLFAASTSERGAIMITLFTIAYTVLYRKKIVDYRTKIILIFFSILLFVYIALYMKLLNVQNPVTGNLLSLLQGGLSFFEQLHSQVYAAKVQEFIIINILLFGIFVFFDWRLTIITFGALLPNLITTVGGAEKTGWGTHYHTMYFPFLLLASAIGFSKLWCSLKRTRYRFMLVGFLLVLMPAISTYSPGYGSISGVITRLLDFYNNGSQSAEKQQAGRLLEIAAAIPVGAKVTAFEAFIPVLYSGRTIYYYPVGIDVADYAVLIKVAQQDGSFYYAGAVSYVTGETKKIDICLTSRLRKAGYNIEKPWLSLGDIVVLERKIK